MHIEELKAKLEYKHKQEVEKAVLDKLKSMSLEEGLLDTAFAQLTASIMNNISTSLTVDYYPAKRERVVTFRVGEHD